MSAETLQIESRNVGDPHVRVSAGQPGRESRELRDIGFICWVAFLFVFALALITERNTDRDIDFVYFYSMGHIAAQSPPGQLYNFKLQSDAFESVRSLAREKGTYYGPSPYPPFIALLFEPFSRLPFQTAFHLWQVFSVLLVIAALSLLLHAFFSGQLLAQSIIYALSLSFYPLIGATLLNGQIAVLALFSFALALVLQKRSRPFLSGLALSLCLYKPTLLLLFVPFLLVRRQWRILSGLLLGGLTIVIVTAAIMGAGAWTSWIAMLPALGKFQPYLILPTYTDVHAFTALLLPHAPVFRSALLLLLLGPAGWFLLKAWRQSQDTGMLWALTLTATLVVNVYVPIYDVSLIIVSIVASAATLLSRFGGKFVRTVMLIALIPWFAPLVAEATRIQLLTISLLLIGSLQYLACLGLRLKNPFVVGPAGMEETPLEIGGVT